MARGGRGDSPCGGGGQPLGGSPVGGGGGGAAPVGAKPLENFLQIEAILKHFPDTWSK